MRLPTSRTRRLITTNQNLNTENSALAAALRSSDETNRNLTARVAELEQQLGDAEAKLRHRPPENLAKALRIIQQRDRTIRRLNEAIGHLTDQLEHLQLANEGVRDRRTPAQPPAA